MDVRNKVIIVTGASGGIGLATARLLCAAGAKVSLAARSKAKLAQISKEWPDSLVVPTDMTKSDEIISMTHSVKKHFGRVDILINNAGRGYDAPIEKTDVNTMQNIYNLDFVGPLIAMQQVIPLMKAQGAGSIINISSGTALMHLPNMGAYSAIKTALAHLSLTAREELKEHHINVSVVYPYITLTDFESNTIKDFVDDDQAEGEESYVPPQTGHT